MRSQDLKLLLFQRAQPRRLYFKELGLLFRLLFLLYQPSEPIIIEIVASLLLFFAIHRMAFEFNRRDYEICLMANHCGILGILCQSFDQHLRLAAMAINSGQQFAMLTK